MAAVTLVVRDLWPHAAHPSPFRGQWFCPVCIAHVPGPDCPNDLLAVIPWPLRKPYDLGTWVMDRD